MFILTGLRSLFYCDKNDQCGRRSIHLNYHPKFFSKNSSLRNPKGKLDPLKLKLLVEWLQSAIISCEGVGLSFSNKKLFRGRERACGD
jgi:hypothetical protein